MRLGGARQQWKYIKIYLVCYDIKGNIDTIGSRLVSFHLDLIFFLLFELVEGMLLLYKAKLRHCKGEIEIL
jgi:hypothetical protein